MSGIEVVSLVVGILPLLNKAVRTYQDVRDKAHTFRHWSREARSVQLLFKIQSRLFETGCTRLLKLVAPDETDKAILTHTHKLWSNQEVDKRLSQQLGDDAELCKEIVEEIKFELEAIRNELRCFDAVTGNMKTGETVMSAIKRLRQTIKITFEKGQFEKRISSLREHNDDFIKVLKRTARHDQKDHQVLRQKQSSGTEALPKLYLETRDVAKELHEALSSRWNCSEPEHTQHNVKIRLDAQPEGPVSVKMAISKHEEEEPDDGKSTWRGVVWLHIQSETHETPGFDLSKLRSSRTQSRLAEIDAEPQKRDVALGVQPSKRRKVCVPEGVQVVQLVATGESLHSPRVSVLSAEVSDELSIEDIKELCGLPSICTHLRRYFVDDPPTGGACCLGHFQLPREFQQTFFVTERLCATVPLWKYEFGDFVPAHNLIRNEDPDQLDFPARILLAKALAEGVLFYHGTPWLSEDWKLEDYAFFGNQKMRSTDFKSLHLTKNILRNRHRAFELMEDVVTSGSLLPELGYHRFGVTNMTLFSLGVAMLEIAHGKPLAEYQDSESLNNIEKARRMAVRRSLMGKRYHDIITKCLQCDFGRGSDLEKRDLQSAVYGEVVQPLETMFMSLEI